MSLDIPLEGYTCQVLSTHTKADPWQGLRTGFNSRVPIQFIPTTFVPSPHRVFLLSTSAHSTLALSTPLHQSKPAESEESRKRIRGVSEVNIRPEILHEGERDLQAFGDDVSQFGLPPTRSSGETKKVQRNRRGFFRRKKSLEKTVDGKAPYYSYDDDSSEPAALELAVPKKICGKDPSEVEDGGKKRTMFFWKRDGPVEKTSRVSSATSSQRTEYYTPNESPLPQTDDRTEGESSEEVSRGQTDYSAFGNRRARGLFSKKTVRSLDFDGPYENRTPSPMRHGLKSLMKAVEDNPEDSPVHYNSPKCHEGTSISESFCWRDERAKEDLWKSPWSDSPTRESLASAQSDFSTPAVTVEPLTHPRLETSMSNPSNTLERKKRFFFFDKKRQEDPSDSMKDKKKFGKKSGKKTAEQLNQMISLVSSEEEDPWVDSWNQWNSPTSCEPVTQQFLPRQDPSSHISQFTKTDATTPSNVVPNIPTSSNNSFDSDWVADFSVFEKQNAVDVRSNIERMLNMTISSSRTDSTESLPSPYCDNTSPLSWQYTTNLSPARPPSFAVGRTEQIAEIVASPVSQVDALNDSFTSGQLQAGVKSRRRQRPTSWFRVVGGASKDGVDVFKEAQTLLDILHETFPESDVDSPGSNADFRTVY